MTQAKSPDASEMTIRMDAISQDAEQQLDELCWESQQAVLRRLFNRPIWRRDCKRVTKLSGNRVYRLRVTDSVRICFIHFNQQFIGSEPAAYRMAVLFTIMANAKRHHLEPFSYVRDLLMKMSSLCAECGVGIPDFTDASDLTGPEFRELGMSLASQLPEESLTSLLPDHWAAANPKQVLAHRIEEARQVANRKRDDREKRREKAAAANLRAATDAPG